MSNELTERVIELIAKVQRIPAASVTIDKTFQELRIDSLDGMNLVFAAESEFDINIPDDQAVSIRSVGEMVAGIEKLLAAGRS